MEAVVEKLNTYKYERIGYNGVQGPSCNIVNDGPVDNIGDQGSQGNGYGGLDPYPYNQSIRGDSNAGQRGYQCMKINIMGTISNTKYLSIEDDLGDAYFNNGNLYILWAGANGNDKRSWLKYEGVLNAISIGQEGELLIGDLYSGELKVIHKSNSIIPVAQGCPRGHKGHLGSSGSMVNLLGNLSDVHHLPTDKKSFDAYLINGDLYVWDALKYVVERSDAYWYKYEDVQNVSDYMEIGKEGELIIAYQDDLTKNRIIKLREGHPDPVGDPGLPGSLGKSI